MDSILRQIHELTDKYLAGLPKRLNDIDSAWQQLQHVNWDAKVLARMSENVHKLTGSGAMYGFGQISSKARQLELFLQAMLDKGLSSEVQRNQVTKALSDLAKALQDAFASGQTSLSNIVIADGDGSPSRQIRSHRIAVIDDDADQAELIMAWLSAQGFESYSFPHPDGYVQASSTLQFDVVLMDICYPQCSLEGLIWLENLQGQVGQHTPFIMMSARTDIVARMRALRAGAVAFFTKPIDFEVLFARLNALTTQSSTYKPRVLWVDDDRNILDFFKPLLIEEGFVVETVTQPLTLMQCLEIFYPDIIVLDYKMPDCNGLELAHILRQDPRYMLLPIVFLSASSEALQQQKQISLVGNAFLIKPIDKLKLIDCLHQQIVKAQLMVRRVRQVSKRSSPVTLTHQYAFLAELDALLGRLEIQPEANVYALIRIDLDNEEYLREAYGVRTMLQISSYIEQVLAKPNAWAGSGCVLGGAAYLGLMSGNTQVQLEDAVHQLLESLKTQSWPVKFMNDLTFSVGTLQLERGINLDRALKQVEQACAQAMQNGGDGIRWHSNTGSLMKSSNELIRQAIQQHSFKILFQPIVNLESGESLLESIVHLKDSAGRLYPPDLYADWLDAGFDDDVYSFDQWILHQAIGRLENENRDSGSSVAIIIPLRSTIAQIERLLPFIGNVVSNSHLKGKRRIAFALSEAKLMENVQRFAQVITRLRALGCGILLEQSDDMTYCSKQLLNDVGEIDFMRLLPRNISDPKEKEALRSLISDCQALASGRVVLIATGVESAADVAAFWELGVRYFQGFFVQESSSNMRYNY